MLTLRPLTYDAHFISIEIRLVFSCKQGLFSETLVRFQKHLNVKDKSRNLIYNNSN